MLATLDLGSRENADESSLRSAFARLLAPSAEGGDIGGIPVSAAGDNWWRVIVEAGEYEFDEGGLKRRLVLLSRCT